jgi:hypothetical protein
MHVIVGSGRHCHLYITASVKAALNYLDKGEEPDRILSMCGIEWFIDTRCHANGLSNAPAFFGRRLPLLILRYACGNK